jgi:hypothetical protein
MGASGAFGSSMPGCSPMGCSTIGASGALGASTPGCSPSGAPCSGASAAHCASTDTVSDMLSSSGEATHPMSAREVESMDVPMINTK